MDLSGELGFRKRVNTCNGCAGPIRDGENWACAQAAIPVMNLPGAFIPFHQHLHVRCSEGSVKWLVLSSLGRSRAALN